jgi:hypothetical protein
VRENCRRLLRATSAACSQAGAIFTTRSTWDMRTDCVAKWIDESGGRCAAGEVVVVVVAVVMVIVEVAVLVVVVVVLVADAF